MEIAPAGNGRPLLLSDKIRRCPLITRLYRSSNANDYRVLSISTDTQQQKRCISQLAQSSGSDVPSPSADAILPSQASHSKANALKSLYKFSRPHTMLGTAISILSISALAMHGNFMMTSAVFIGLVQALAAALLMNISIVGTNQIFDISIDKINKPYLPLAAGEFSPEIGWGIVTFATVVSLLIGWHSGSPALMCTLSISWVLGLLYSIELPFMR
jgi:homogentisate phytyltransferase/homogentisate geranylgeranyltransferase